MIVTRKIIEIKEELCDGCGLCVPDCAEGSLKIINGKVKLVSDNLCDGLGACLGSCPTGALKVIEREAEEFDEDAVEEFLASQEQEENDNAGCGCASTELKTFAPMPSLSPCETANRPLMQQMAGDSALSHWPVQIRLIPPTAPFLKNADLLIAADCTALAYASLHRDYIDGRVVMMGCPKFDDQDMYVQRLSEVFRDNDLSSLTILIMEVPCCASMIAIVTKALERSGVTFPIRQVVIGSKGAVLEEKDW